MPGVVEVIRFAAAVARQDAVDRERHQRAGVAAPAVPLDRELDRRIEDSAIVGDEVLPDEAGRAAGVASGDLPQRLALRRIGRRVDDDAKDPVAVRHDFAGADDLGEFDPVEPGGTGAPLVDAKDQDG